MSTVVLYCWCHSDSASVLLYFTFETPFSNLDIYCPSSSEVALLFVKTYTVPCIRIWTPMYHHYIVEGQKRSTEGCSKLKRSVDMTSSGKNGLNIRTNASPKWDRTRCQEE